jgi:hypothetical protein
VQQETISVVTGQRIPLTEATAEQCLYAAETAARLARGNLVRQEWLTALAAEMKKRRVRTVGDLPARVLDALRQP